MNKGNRFLKALWGLRQRHTWGPFTEAFEISQFDHSFTISWSQGGEDLALLSIFNSRKKGTYIDVGAHHPTRFSVTRSLYQRGWRGLNIEANSELLPNFWKHRSKDTNLNFAIGTQGSYEFTIFQEPALSTHDIHWKEKFLSEGAVPKKTVVVPGRTLRSVLDEYFPSKPPTLLCIDAEGSDLDVLLSLELSSLETSRRPEFLLLETTPPVSNALTTPAVSLALKFGYEPQLILPMATIMKLERNT